MAGPVSPPLQRSGRVAAPTNPARADVGQDRLVVGLRVGRERVAGGEEPGGEPRWLQDRRELRRGRAAGDPARQPAGRADAVPAGRLRAAGVGLGGRRGRASSQRVPRERGSMPRPSGVPVDDPACAETCAQDDARLKRGTLRASLRTPVDLPGANGLKTLVDATCHACAQLFARADLSRRLKSSVMVTNASQPGKRKSSGPANAPVIPSNTPPSTDCLPRPPPTRPGIRTRRR